MNLENTITRKNVSFSENKYNVLIEDSDSETTEDEDIKEVEEKLSGLWLDLQESLELLETFKRDEVQAFIKDQMKDDADAIIEEFNREFEGVADNNPVKFEVLCLLGKLGIEIYDEAEEAKRKYKLEQLEKKD